MGRGYDGVSNSKLKIRALGSLWQSEWAAVWSGATQTTDWGKGCRGGWGESGVSGWRQDWRCLPSTHGTGDHSIKSWKNRSRQNHSKGMKGRNYSKSWCSPVCWQPPHGSSLTCSRLSAESDGEYLANRYLFWLGHTQKNHCSSARTQQCGASWSNRGWASLSVLNHPYISSCSINRAVIKGCEEESLLLWYWGFHHSSSPRFPPNSVREQADLGHRSLLWKS